MTELQHWPETLEVDTAVVLADESEGLRALSAAERDSQWLRLRDPIQFGEDAARDIAALKFLQAATARYARLQWELAGDLPWSLRTVVHLCPPVERDDNPVTMEWREGHGIAQCTYRIGPNFVLLRDSRPAGRKIRAQLGESWLGPFHGLLADGTRGKNEASDQLLDELTSADLTVMVGDGRYVLLPTRLHRWPVPYYLV